MFDTQCRNTVLHSTLCCRCSKSDWLNTKFCESWLYAVGIRPWIFGFLGADWARLIQIDIRLGQELSTEKVSHTRGDSTIQQDQIVGPRPLPIHVLEPITSLWALSSEGWSGGANQTQIMVQRGDYKLPLTRRLQAQPCCSSCQYHSLIENFAQTYLTFWRIFSCCLICETSTKVWIAVCI